MDTALRVKRDIHLITTEIRTIREQTARMVLDNSIEIGRRLFEAKEQIPHGEWGDYLRDEVEYSQSTANNLMRIFEEYGDAQGSLFGATAKSQTLGNLTYSKALALLAVPSDERETFVEENNVGDMSTRELERAIQERDDALAAKKETEKKLQELQAAETRADEAAAEIEQLQFKLNSMRSELEELRSAEPEPSAGPDDGEIERIRNEAAASAKNEAEEKLRKKIAKAEEDKAKAETARIEAERERDRIKQEQSDMTDKIERLEKQLKVSGSQTVTEFKVHFEAAQASANKCLAKLDGETDTELRAKLSSALRAWCENMLADLPSVGR